MRDKPVGQPSEESAGAAVITVTVIVIVRMPVMIMRCGRARPFGRASTVVAIVVVVAGAHDVILPHRGWRGRSSIAV